MIPVVDSNGTPITGVFRDESGAIIVDDTAKKAKYDKERQLVSRITNLEQRIVALEQLLSKSTGNE